MTNKEALHKALKHIHWAAGYMQLVDKYQFDEYNYMIPGHTHFEDTMNNLASVEGAIASLIRIDREDNSSSS